MEIMGSIQSENVNVGERERIQRQMREFIGGLQVEWPREMKEVAYKIHFWRPFFGSKVDSVIEFRTGLQDAWFARANGPDPWRAFSKALGSLKQIIIEMELREDKSNVRDNGSPA
jgi:hypothetical protein